MACVVFNMSVKPNDEINNLQLIEKPAVERRCCNHSWLRLCSTPQAGRGSEVQTQAAYQLAALLHQSGDKEGQGTQQGLACPSSASLFLVAPLLISDVHTFLSSYLIIFIMKMIFMSAARREGKKDGDNESTRGGRAVSPQCFCQSLGHLPKETGSVSTHLHRYFRQSRIAKWQIVTPFWISASSPFGAGLVRGWAAAAFLDVQLTRFVPVKTKCSITCPNSGCWTRSF